MTSKLWYCRIWFNNGSTVKHAESKKWWGLEENDLWASIENWRTGWRKRYERDNGSNNFILLALFVEKYSHLPSKWIIITGYFCQNLSPLYHTMLMIIMGEKLRGYKGKIVGFYKAFLMPKKTINLTDHYIP